MPCLPTYLLTYLCMCAGLSADERLRRDSVAAERNHQRPLANDLRVQRVYDRLAQRTVALQCSFDNASLLIISRRAVALRDNIFSLPSLPVFLSPSLPSSRSQVYSTDVYPASCQVFAFGLYDNLTPKTRSTGHRRDGATASPTGQPIVRCWFFPCLL